MCNICGRIRMWIGIKMEFLIRMSILIGIKDK
jgi:hypothetical protein